MLHIIVVNHLRILGLSTIIASIAFCSMPVVSQVRLSDYWWSNSAAARQFHYHPLWGVIVNSDFGVFSGPDVDHLTQLLPTEQYIRIKALNKVAMLENGTWIVSGGTLARETKRTTYLFSKPGTEPRVLGMAALDGQNLGGGLDKLNLYKAFDTSYFGIVETYSSNSGATWTFAPQPDSLLYKGGISVFFGHQILIPGVGIVAYSPADSTWRLLDLAAKHWNRTSVLPNNVREVEFLKDGMAVGAVTPGFQLYNAIAVRPSADSAWRTISKVAVANETNSYASMNALYSSNSKALLRHKDSIVIVPADSGTVIIANGKGATAYRVHTDTIHVKALLTSGSKAMIGEDLFVNYTDINGSTSIMIVFNIRSKQSRIVSDKKIRSLL